MDTGFRLLGQTRRNVARKVARRAYVDRQELSVAEYRDEIRNRLSTELAFQSVIASILIGVAVRLAIELIKYWIDNQQSSPAAGGFQVGEPGI